MLASIGTLQSIAVVSFAETEAGREDTLPKASYNSLGGLG